MSKYQDDARKFLIFSPPKDYSNLETMLAWMAMGLSGESGEVTDLIKKAVFHEHRMTAEFRAKLTEELGDVLWYVAAICSLFGIDMTEVENVNIIKCNRRYPGGFDTQKSKDRS